MKTDLKLKFVRFCGCAEIAGHGPAEKLNLGIDSETGRPFLPGVSATYIAEGRGVRISTPSGETWVPVENVASMWPIFEDRLEAARKSKTSK
jgi:hypothetical protein